jgi:hypothetical protein
MSGDEIDVETNEPSEETVVRWNRYKEARRSGLSIIESQLWADTGGDVGLLRRCVKNGWDADQIRQLLL